MNNSTINHYLERHEKVLQNIVHQADIPAPDLKAALQYCLFPGGKRIRPLLVYLCGELTGASLESLDVIAAAIELIHCYSLIHDDLPAMDNDDVRRGRPTCHRAFTEATAILAGDGIQGLACEVLLTRLPSVLPPQTVIQIATVFMKAIGFSGMVSGQSLDLTELSQPTVTETILQHIHRLKTGALFSACINLALLAGHPDEVTRESLQRFGDNLGIVFQMQDDYHDRYSSSEILGKNRASDSANQKTTFAMLFNQQELLDLIHQYYNQAFREMSRLGPKANALEDLTHFLYQRTPQESL